MSQLPTQTHPNWMKPWLAKGHERPACVGKGAMQSGCDTVHCRHCTIALMHTWIQPRQAMAVGATTCSPAS